MATNPGALRFNSDSQKLELFDGNQWVEIVASSPDSQTGGTRGFAFGCVAPTFNNYYYNIASTGNAIDFGDFSANRYFCSACSDRTRAVVDSGEGTMTSKQFFTMASGGGGTTFGNVSYHPSNGHRAAGAVSNTTRGIFAGGDDFVTYSFNNIEYITIQSTGTAVDFGDLYQATRLTATGNSTTRGIFAGGSIDPAFTNVIQFITTSTLGNSADFGDISLARTGAGGCSNAVRMLIGGGITNTPANTYYNIIEYITISTLGNSIDFGDLTAVRTIVSASSSPIRGVFAGGNIGPANLNTIDYVTIASTGNAIDFGDLLENTYTMGGTSNGHGGL
jgi:hypothetical protein